MSASTVGEHWNGEARTLRRQTAWVIACVLDNVHYELAAEGLSKHFVSSVGPWRYYARRRTLLSVDATNASSRGYAFLTSSKDLCAVAQSSARPLELPTRCCLPSSLALSDRSRILVVAAFPGGCRRGAGTRAFVSRDCALSPRQS